MVKGASSSSSVRRGTVGLSASRRRALAELTLARPASGPFAREVKADLPKLRKNLGRPCPHFGKKGVLQFAMSRSAQASNPAAAPRFNKYAGWVEWKNAVFLWINAQGGLYVNTFKRSGRQVTWYVGGPRPSVTSPIVKRLLAASKDTSVELFVRKHATTPYVYCGSCKYVAHDDTKKGFEFTWELANFDALAGQPAFRDLLSKRRTAAERAASRWA
mmetsp:Transcript_40480/g.93064  ORF Transcript_40480/g.93064 Transcript_40480/m.93064 type:complete len:217 (+) Transcript_40480:109-759(+)